MINKADQTRRPWTLSRICPNILPPPRPTTLTFLLDQANDCLFLTVACVTIALQSHHRQGGNLIAVTPRSCVLPIPLARIQPMSAATSILFAVLSLAPCFIGNATTISGTGCITWACPVLSKPFSTRMIRQRPQQSLSQSQHIHYLVYADQL